eukprot:COSAG06_NODE_3303_length_5532_cov_4.124425_3_plen_113_part_00
MNVVVVTSSAVVAQEGGEPLHKRGLAAAGGLAVRAEQCAKLSLRVLGPDRHGGALVRKLIGVVASRQSSRQSRHVARARARANRGGGACTTRAWRAHIYTRSSSIPSTIVRL